MTEIVRCAFGERGVKSSERGPCREPQGERRERQNFNLSIATGLKKSVR